MNPFDPYKLLWKLLQKSTQQNCSKSVTPSLSQLRASVLGGGHHTCQLFLFWRNSSSFRSKKENDFIMCSCFCSNLCIVMYRKFRNVPLFKFFSLICSSFWNLKVGKYGALTFKGGTGLFSRHEPLSCLSCCSLDPSWSMIQFFRPHFKRN